MTFSLKKNLKQEIKNSIEISHKLLYDLWCHIVNNILHKLGLCNTVCYFYMFFHNIVYMAQNYPIVKLKINLEEYILHQSLLLKMALVFYGTWPGKILVWITNVCGFDLYAGKLGKEDWTETEGRWRGGEAAALVLQSEALTSSQL